MREGERALCSREGRRVSSDVGGDVLEAGAAVRYERLSIFGLSMGTLNESDWGIAGLLRSGDFNCPPKGLDLPCSIGNLMGPKGDISCTFNHEPNVGGFGGCDGFHGTNVVLVLPERRGVGWWKSDKDAVEGRPGSSVRDVVRAPCDATAVELMIAETGALGSLG